MFTLHRYRSDARTRRMEDAGLAARNTTLIKGLSFLDGAAALSVDSSAFVPALTWTRLDSFYLSDRADSAVIGQWIRSAHSDGSARAFAVVRDGGTVSILFGSGSGRSVLPGAFRANSGEAELSDPADWPIPRYEYCGLLLGGDTAAGRLAEAVAAADRLTGCYAAVVMLPLSQAESDALIKQDQALADRLQPYAAVRRTYGAQTQRQEVIPDQSIIRALEVLRSEAALLRDHGADGVVRTALLYGAASEAELQVLASLVRSCAGQGADPGRKPGLSQVRSMRLFGGSRYLAIPGVKLPSGPPETVYPLSLQSVSAAASYCLPPLRSYDGCCRHTTARDTLYPAAEPVTEAAIPIGRLADSGREAVIPLRSLLSHCAVFGTTSAGKTTTIKTLITRAFQQRKIPFIVIEASKKDYYSLCSAVPELRVYGSGADGLPLKLNPLQPETGVLVESHISAVANAITAAMPAEHPIPDALERLLQITYERCGWFPGQVAYEDPKRPWPVLHDVLDVLPAFMRTHGDYGPEVKKNLQAALTLRVESLCNGALGRLFAGRTGLQARDLLAAPTVIELADLDAGRDFLMSLLLFNLHACLSHLPPSGRLERLIVVEEAHRVFRKTLLEGSSHGRNVTALENMLAEIRCSGTGLILADQRPSVMADGVFANTSVMICHAIGSAADRAVIQGSMNLTDQQAEGVKNLRPGECLLSLTGFRGVQHAMADRPALGTPAPAACVLCQSRFRCRLDQVRATLAGLDQAKLRYHVSRLLACPYDVENVGKNTAYMFSRLNIAPAGAERLCLLGAILEQQAGLPSQSCRIILANYMKYLERSQVHG